MNDKQVAQELVKLARAIMSGCEKLPEGPMRDNCEKKKEEGKDKKEDGKKAAAQELVKLARSLTAAAGYNVKGDTAYRTLMNLHQQVIDVGEELREAGIFDVERKIGFILDTIYDAAQKIKRVEKGAEPRDF